jgi:hypothetical protein
MDIARLRDLELGRPPPAGASHPHVPDPEQERRFEDHLNESVFHGRDGAREAVIEHLAWCRISVDEEAANVVLDLWCRYGIDHEGVGHFLDRLCRAFAKSGWQRELEEIIRTEIADEAARRRALKALENAIREKDSLIDGLLIFTGRLRATHEPDRPVRG